MVFLWNVFIYLIKPHPNETAEQYGVRLIMAAIGVATAGLLAAHMLWSVSAFASSEDMKEVKVFNLDTQIIDARERQCKAIASSTPQNSNTDAKRFAVDRLNRLIREYKKVTGDTYRVPRCEELS